MKISKMIVAIILLAGTLFVGKNVKDFLLMKYIKKELSSKENYSDINIDFEQL